jgi:hypothetical protein
MSHWLYPLRDCQALVYFFQHTVYADCKHPYKICELVLDKTAEITYFLYANLFFYIPHLLSALSF